MPKDGTQLLDMWVIWSNEHDMWWKANENGYTNSLMAAGVYPLVDASRIERSAEPGNEKAMPLPIAVMFELGRLESFGPRSTVGRLMLATLDRLHTLVGR